MIWAVLIAAALLTVAAVAATARLLLGPSVADRMVALDTLLYVGVAAIGTYIVHTGSTIFLPVLIVAALIAFLGTVIVARYIEAESDQ